VKIVVEVAEVVEVMLVITEIAVKVLIVIVRKIMSWFFSNYTLAIYLKMG